MPGGGARRASAAARPNSACRSSVCSCSNCAVRACKYGPARGRAALSCECEDCVRVSFHAEAAHNQQLACTVEVTRSSPGKGSVLTSSLPGVHKPPSWRGKAATHQLVHEACVAEHDRVACALLLHRLPRLAPLLHRDCPRIQRAQLGQQVYHMRLAMWEWHGGTGVVTCESGMVPRGPIWVVTCGSGMVPRGPTCGCTAHMQRHAISVLWAARHCLLQLTR